MSLRTSAEIYGALRRNGVTIGIADILISGIAVSNKLILVTNNSRHYQAVSDLITSNWNITELIRSLIDKANKKDDNMPF